MEYRVKDVSLECNEEGILKIGGYINVTERPSEMLYSKRSRKWFKEIMCKGVFQRAIDKAKEIPLLFEHDWDKQLASTRNNSLTLKEDQIGLRFDAVIEDENVYNQVRSGAINSCSFGFKALEEKFESVNEKFEKRYVSGIELLEVSLVKNPAYVGSLVESRAYEEELETDEEVKADKEEKSEEVKEKEVKEKEEKNPKDKSEKESEEVAEENPDSNSEDKEKEESKEKPKKASKENSKESSKEENKEPEENSEEENKENRTVTLGEEPVNEIEEPSIKEDLKEVVDNVISKTEEQLKLTEMEEQYLQEHIEIVKQENKEIENHLEDTSRVLNSEIIKLRLELLKLQHIKDGI